MVAAVPAKISKLRPPSTRSLPLLTTHRTLPTLFLSPPCFHTLTNCFSRKSFALTTIRIARRGGGYFRSALHEPGNHESQVTHFLQLAASLSLFALFFRRAPFIFNRLQPLLPKCRGGASRTLLRDTRGWGGDAVPHYPLLTAHYPLSLLIQQLAWWKRVQECRCE